ncbi:glucans biosynthesis glucosyltransferase MdoH [Oceaniglobus roseus]|uniref:glucans biosynthesis glucosyltransferase MdoH n=1 Tax=Oceaniglobus roseus TaxID=1737570 RepID=UPI001FE50B9A|nr:glucans biosynthesis glucosyltransferase MdoH [Kandeliimicrobium roseum]
MPDGSGQVRDTMADFDGVGAQDARFVPATAPSDTAPSEIARRRRLILALNVATCAVLFAAMLGLLSFEGIMASEWAMLLAYSVTLPWLSIGLWNSVIGFALDRRYGPRAAVHVAPVLGRIAGSEPVVMRTAIVMPLRNEDPAESLRRLHGLERALAATPWGACFDFHVLSDTDRPAVAAAEEAAVAALRAGPAASRIVYRRRSDNRGYKAGNIAEFLQRRGDDYDFLLPLDADSVMGAATVLRLVRVMQAAPELGMLQSLVAGMPSKTFFTRAFQFGMRHGMRSYTLGSAWWQADCGPNWGHNVLIRTAPFREHCMLPVLPGRGPLSGDILSHDQLEAAMMRRAGYEVRGLAEESESYEENPPSLADFIRRELRWCNGNMQYLRLLGMPGLKPVSRIQLYLAVQMYLAAPAWMVFIGLGAWLAASGAQVEGTPLWAALGLFAALMVLNLMPKLMGLGQILAERSRAAAYGGRGQGIRGGLAEILVSMLMAPIVAFALTRFLVGLAFGRRIGWDAQQRSRARLEWGEAARVLWPQTLAGAALALWLGLMAPWAMVFAAPILLSLLLAVPIAVLTTAPGLSRWSIDRGLFDIPEDRHPASPPPVPALNAI